MAYELPLFYIGLLASDVDLSALQFTGVNVIAAAHITGAGTGGAALGVPSAGDPILGILQNGPKANEAGQVMAHGLSKAVLSGTVAIGNILACDGAGALKVATSGQYGVAQAMESGSSGDTATVFVKNFGKQ